MKERPILFSAPMVRALLSGQKTQTRRAVKGIGERTLEFDRQWFANVMRPGDNGVWTWWDGPPHGQSIYHAARCPYGQVGDRLWVRETWSAPHVWEALGSPPSEINPSEPIWYWAEGNPAEGDWMRPRPSIHMPRWASRLTLEITEVRVERLPDISEPDAILKVVSLAPMVSGLTVSQCMPGQTPRGPITLYGKPSTAKEVGTPTLGSGLLLSRW